MRPFAKGASQSCTLYLSQDGSDAEPTYTLRRPDPSSPSARGCYAAALFDAYTPDVLFGEVLIKPNWTPQVPSSSATGDPRRNGGGTTTQSPEPIIPSEFTIQLYAPDQQVQVRQKQGSWGASAHWEFELPQRTFRQPSGSDLDRSQTDPAAADTTPKLSFRWKRDGKLSKDLVCQLSGRSGDRIGGRKRSVSKEPDITIALFRHLREITVYEPNLSRVEMEDLKGLEVVLLLSASVIRDVYFGNVKDVFNIPSAERRQSDPNKQYKAYSAPAASGATSKGDGLSGITQQSNQTRLNGAHPQALTPASQPPDPDRETARLKAQLEAEQRAKAKEDEAEVRRIRKMLEAEEKEIKRRQAAIDKETERLRRKYGAEQQQKAARQAQQASPPPGPSPLPPALAVAGGKSRPAPLQHGIGTFPHAQSAPAPHASQGGGFRSLLPQSAPPQSQQKQRTASSRPHPSAGGLLPPTGHHASTTLPSKPDDGLAHKGPAAKKSMFGLRSTSEDAGRKLNKKRSSLF